MAAEVLKVGDVGPYAAQSSKANPDNLSLVYVPALTLVLSRAAELKGKSLTDAEVTRITNRAEVVAMPKAVADSVIRERGGIK